MLKDYFTGVYKNRYVLASLVGSDLRSKYRNSLLGVAWSVITPLGLSLVIGLVYSVIFGVNPVDFIPTLFAGLNPWLFISTSADGGTMAFIGAEGYIKQTTVSAQIFPLRVVFVNFINLLYALTAFFAIYLFMQPGLFGPKMLMVFPGLAILFVFCLACANVSSVINIHIRDFQPLQSLILQGLFYATPIIYPAATLQAKGFGLVYRLNPFYYMLEVVRTPILGKTLPSAGVYEVAVFIAAVYFLFSVVLVMRTRAGIAFKL